MVLSSHSAILHTGEGPSANPFAGLECEDTAVVATVGEEEAGKRLGTPEEVPEKQGGEQEAVLGVMACVLLRWRELLMRMAAPSAAAVFFVFFNGRPPFASAAAWARCPAVHVGAGGGAGAGGGSAALRAASCAAGPPASASRC